MFKLRLIAAALLAMGLAALFSPAARAEMLERDECKVLQAEKQTLLTASVKAALTRGPDWVKDHLHDKEEIEKVRAYLQVEEKVAFRCRTDGVRVPKPLPPPMPDPKPPVPEYVVDVNGKTPKIIAGVAAMSFLPLRKPSLFGTETAEDAPETAEAEVPGADGIGDVDDAEEVTAATETNEAQAGPSQAVADSDKTAPSENKATQ
jgi:hypothetical protein